MGKHTLAWKVGTCGHRTKQLRMFKSEYLCYKCYVKRIIFLGGPSPRRSRTMPLKQCLEKVHQVKTYYTGNPNKLPYCLVRLPYTMHGKKVKLILVTDDTPTEKMKGGLEK